MTHAHPSITFRLDALLILGDGRLADAPKQTPAKLDTKVDVKLDYLLDLPPDYDKKDSWPLLIFLHGAGKRGSDLELVKKHGPPKLIEAGKSFPFVVISPSVPRIVGGR